MNLPLHEATAAIGKFPKVFQIFPSISLHMQLQQEKAHELLSEGPQGPIDTAAGDLTYHGGPTIGGSAKVFNVYLGTTNFDAADFDAFTKAIVENGYYLSPDGKDSANGTFIGSAKVVWPFNSMTVDNSSIEAWVNSFVPNIPGHDTNTMVSLIMPPGSTVTMQGSASCSSFCGYHSMTSQGNYYQVIDDTSCAGCNTGNPNDGRMMVQAHEYAEWRSDPQGTGWYNNTTGMENADECAWQRIPWGPAEKNWVVQPSWVNGRNCVAPPYVASGPPPPPPTPQTTAMAMRTQPQSTVVGAKAPDFSVQLLLADGSTNVSDSSTIVTMTLPGFSDIQAVKATLGICTFAGEVFHKPHSQITYHFASGNLPGINSAPFDVTAAPPPPPGTKTWMVTGPDGVVHHLTEV